MAKKKKKPSHQIYDWNKWLDEDNLPVTLRRGKHFQVEVELMTRQIYNAAHRRGYRVSLTATKRFIKILSVTDKAA